MGDRCVENWALEEDWHSHLCAMELSSEHCQRKADHAARSGPCSSWRNGWIGWHGTDCVKRAKAQWHSSLIVEQTQWKGIFSHCLHGFTCSFAISCSEE